MKKSFLLFVIVWIFIGCKSTDFNKTASSSENDDFIQTMTLDQKIGQMFVIRPGAIDPEFFLNGGGQIRGQRLTKVTEFMKNIYAQYPCGGFVLFSENIENPEQLIDFNGQLHALGGETGNIKPFIFVDEEGGLVARLANHPAFNLPKYGCMAEIGNSGDPELAFEAGAIIGNYLKKYGFDADFAPVADVFTNPENTVIGRRAFSTNPEIAALMVINCLEGLHTQKISGCLKHFPGHGDTSLDSHYGLPETKKNWQELLECEMIPFKAAIDSGAEMIMTAHITVPNVTGHEKPATLSPEILTEKLRKELGFNGVIITDALEMDAISFVSSENMEDACVEAILAGADMLLLPTDYKNSFETVKQAVLSGKIPEERINESVRRILKYKGKFDFEGS